MHADVGEEFLASVLQACAKDIDGIVDNQETVVIALAEVDGDRRILLDIADSTGKDYDELLLEQHGNVCWVHFAVRPPSQQNRRRISFLRP